MWFDRLMDDIKSSLKISSENKVIFTPMFIKLGFSILGIIFSIIGAVVTIAGISVAAINWSVETAPENIVKMLVLLLPLLITTFIIALCVRIVIDVGSIHLCNEVVKGNSPKFSEFFKGIKTFTLRGLGGNLLLTLFAVILSPLILALVILYLVTCGILAGNWAFSFLSAIISTYFGIWTTIMIVDNISPLDAIKKGFDFANKNFKMLLILMLAYNSILAYVLTLSGPVIMIIGTWFIEGIFTAILHVILIQVYNRDKEVL